MACPGSDTGRRRQQHQQPDSNFEPAFQEAQNWIEAVTGRRFGGKDFRAGLENGILLCELLSSIKPGLVKKINRLPTPIAGLDNLTLFLRGCEELGLKGSQLFDPGDLLDSSTYPNAKGSDCSRKLKNVLITIYWLGRAANCCTSYNGPALDLNEFQGLLSQMQKEAGDAESPKRSVRDSGYIDCWDSERSDSLSPPRHCRDDSFDSLDSFGSRSQRTPSPDVAFRGSSDGRGSDSESDAPQRRLPDMRKDDMLARRTSVTEPRTTMPFNQFLPNKSNQSAYVPGARHRRDQELEEGPKSWSTATSPVGGERPFRYSHRSSVSDDVESTSMIDMRCEEDVFLPHHTQAHHQLIHSQYQQLREEENIWQADLARWKSRRRSISQDLIKKEEERKTMERLMSGDSNICQRRKSIKTYKEIVQDKERRERELYEAYHKAHTPEEAAAILQRYAERFTLSELVLVQLNLPRQLERSVSAEPAAVSQEASPMKYLRQQSVPLPRFTSTVEAVVSGVPNSQARGKVTPPHSSPSHDVVGATSQRIQSVQDGSSGRRETFRRGENDGSQEEPPMQFLPSLDSAAVFHSMAEAPPPEPTKVGPDQKRDSRLWSAPPGTESCSPVSLQTAAGLEEATTIQPMSLLSAAATMKATPTQPTTPPTAPLKEATPTQPISQPTGLQAAREEHARSSSSQGNAAETDAAAHSSHADVQPVRDTPSSCESTVTTNGGRVVTTTVLPQRPSVHPQYDSVAGRGAEMENPVLQSSHKAADISLSAQKRTEAVRTSQPSGPRFSDPAESIRTNIPGLMLNLSGRVERWVWNPDEERKRQERWQREQERLLQEKYLHQQEKLRRDWERAQQEVQEEGRRYKEEERRILEETVAPLTPNAPPSNKGPLLPIVRSLADWERKQELLERQTKVTEKGDELTEHRGNPVAEQKVATEISAKATESTWVHNSSLARGVTYTEQNGQRRPGELSLLTAPEGSLCHMKMSPGERQGGSHGGGAGQRTASLERNWSPQQAPPGGVKRTGSFQHIVTNSSKSPSSSSSSSSLSDTQPPSPIRSVSGKKLCSSCGHPLGKGAAMIIETLSLYFHINCFKCGICEGQLGDTSAGTDVRIRNGLLNCHQCYIRSRVAGQPTTL